MLSIKKLNNKFFDSESYFYRLVLRIKNNSFVQVNSVYCSFSRFYKINFFK